jgi:hypothetical protein
MRKKTVAIVTVGLMVAGLLGGCGNKTVTKVDEDTMVIEDASASSETEEETEEITEEEVTTEEIPEPSDILAENGIVITPQAEVTSFQGAVVVNGEYTDDTISVPLSVTVTTTPCEEEEGYADTVAVYEIHQPDDYHVAWYLQPFDRYTGCALDTANSSIQAGESIYGNVTLVEVDGTQYDISGDLSIEGSWSIENPEEIEASINTITLHHPIDYDGAVFAIGGNTASHAEYGHAIDWENSVLVTDYPDFLHGFEFFCTATDQ